MPDSKISNAIVEAKKFNVALKSVTFNRVTKQNEWGRNLFQAENDFKITLNETDKKAFLKKKEDNRKELDKRKFHNSVIEQMTNIFQFEKRKRTDGKDIDVSTKDAAQLLNDSAELLGLLLKAFEISTSQIRKYLDSLRKIKANSSPDTFSPSDVLLQQVKIAYAAGRDSDLNFLYEVLKPAITNGSNDYEHFEQLLRFVEAIVAYHRFYRGED